MTEVGSKTRRIPAEHQWERRNVSGIREIDPMTLQLRETGSEIVISRNKKEPYLTRLAPKVEKDTDGRSHDGCEERNEEKR